MDDPGLDATTLRSPDGRRGGRGHKDATCLTIAWHPDPGRVGEQTTLPARAALSRLEPEFAAAGGRAAPLADANISRRPIRLRVEDSGDVEISVEGAGSALRVGGMPVGGTLRLSRGEIDRGVVLELAERVVLVLHRGAADEAGGDGHGLVGGSAAIAWVRRQIDKVAGTDVSVLIRGPTGAGKELVARAIHAASDRAAGPFVAVNLVTLPAATAASQLFGHKKGAFTGATADHRGFFAAADGGTLFLDEIGETPMDLQAMLLRALETGEVIPVGATDPVAVDVRVIAASDADLELAVREDRFRSPLFHRLAGYPIPVPPLRRRREDIGRLLACFLGEELAALGAADRLAPRPPTEPMWLSAAQVARLLAHRWPGNVRELRNAARQLAIAARDEDRVEDAAIDRALAPRAAVDDTAPRAEAPRPRRRPEDIGDADLLEALRAHRFKTGAAAAALGISRTTLYALIERSPSIRKARDLEAGEIERALEAASGDVAAAAAALEVSARGLKLRIKQLGIGDG